MQYGSGVPIPAIAKSFRAHLSCTVIFSIMFSGCVTTSSLPSEHVVRLEFKSSPPGATLTSKSNGKTSKTPTTWHYNYDKAEIKEKRKEGQLLFSAGTVRWPDGTEEFVPRVRFELDGNAGWREEDSKLYLDLTFTFKKPVTYEFTMNYKSSPPGATITQSSNGLKERAPFAWQYTFDQADIDKARSNGVIRFGEVTARWPDGSERTLNARYPLKNNPPWTKRDSKYFLALDTTIKKPKPSTRPQIASNSSSRTGSSSTNRSASTNSRSGNSSSGNRSASSAGQTSGAFPNAKPGDWIAVRCYHPSHRDNFNGAFPAVIGQRILSSREPAEDRRKIQEKRRIHRTDMLSTSGVRPNKFDGDHEPHMKYETSPNKFPAFK